MRRDREADDLIAVGRGESLEVLAGAGGGRHGPLACFDPAVELVRGEVDPVTEHLVTEGDAQRDRRGAEWRWTREDGAAVDDERTGTAYRAGSARRARHGGRHVPISG